MLNFKKIFSKAQKKKEVENFADFCGKHLFFMKIAVFEYFGFLDWKKAFNENKDLIFVISSSNSIR